MKETPIATTGIIIERKGSFHFTASLPNGKIIMTHTTKRLDALSHVLKPGDRVSLEMTPFDFDKGRISGKID
jgi:translation initiation factor IF-1